MPPIGSIAVLFVSGRQSDTHLRRRSRRPGGLSANEKNHPVQFPSGWFILPVEESIG